MDLFYILLQPVASAIIVIVFTSNLILLDIYVFECDLCLAKCFLYILRNRIRKQWKWFGALSRVEYVIVAIVQFLLSEVFLKLVKFELGII